MRRLDGDASDGGGAAKRAKLPLDDGAPADDLRPTTRVQRVPDASWAPMELQQWAFNIVQEEMLGAAQALVVCERCLRGDDEAVLILCESCERVSGATITACVATDWLAQGFHTYCLEPKLSEVPEGDWTCQLCFHASDIDSSDDDDDDDDNNRPQRIRRRRKRTNKRVLFADLYTNSERHLCGCGAAATASVVRQVNAAPAPGEPVSWPAASEWKCESCAVDARDAVYSLQRSALAQFAPDLATQLPAPESSRLVVAWSAAPIGRARAKSAGRFSPALDALLAFALDRFATINAPVEGGVRRNFELAAREYFPMLSKNVLRLRYDYCVLKARNDDANALRDLAQRWGLSVKPHDDGNDGNAVDDGNNDDGIDEDSVADKAEAAALARAAADKECRMEAVLGPLRRREWDGSVSCSHCAKSIRSGSIHRCQSCAIVYCDECAAVDALRHHGAHVGVAVFLQWDVRGPPKPDVATVKRLAKQFGVTVKQLKQKLAAAE